MGSNPPEDLEEVLRNLLNDPIRDEVAVLRIIIEAITSKCTDTHLIEQAVTQVMHNYENHLRVFMVAAANTHLARVARLSENISKLEDKFSDPSALDLEDKDYIRLYSQQQKSMMESLDYIKKVADMRIEQAAALGSTANVSGRDLDKINKIGQLSPFQRDRVRKIIDAVMELPEEVDPENED